jgi:pentapeptide MXKDX repeat protein
MRQENMRQENMRQESMRQENMRQENMRQENMRQENMRQESMRQESMRQENMRQNTPSKPEQKSEQKNIKLNHPTNESSDSTSENIEYDLSEDEKSGELFYGKTLSKREKALLDSAGVVSKKELIPEAARERDNNVSLDVPYLEHLDIKFSKGSNFSKARMNLFASSTFERCDLSSIGVNDMRFRHCNFEEGCKLPDDLSESM